MDGGEHIAPKGRVEGFQAPDSVRSKLAPLYPSAFRQGGALLCMPGSSNAALDLDRFCARRFFVHPVCTAAEVAEALVTIREHHPG